MDKGVFQKRLQRCGRLMKDAGFDVLVLTKPANMFSCSRDFGFLVSMPGAQLRIEYLNFERVLRDDD